MRASVLVVLLDVPVPATTGLHLRMVANLRLVRELGCRSTALVFRTADRPLLVPELDELCDGIVDGGRRAEYSLLSGGRRAGLRALMAAAAVSGRPSHCYPYSIPYDEVGGREIVQLAADRSGCTGVLLPTLMAHYAPPLRERGLVVIGDAIDVLSSLSWRLLRSVSRSRPLRAPGLGVNFLASRAQERLFLRAFDEIWASSEAEAHQLLALAPGCNVLVAGNTVDAGLCLPVTSGAGQRVGFIGTYTSLPNLEAARFLATRVTSALRAQVPRAHVALAGAGLSRSDAEALARIDGVEVVGAVPDARAFVGSCSVMAFPIRVRGGVPLKLIEAMACGTPIVASPELVEGLDLRPGIDLLVAEDPGAWVRGLKSVLTDERLATRLGREARSSFERRFSFEAILAEARTRSVLVGGQRA